MLKNLNLTFNKSNPHPRNRYGSIANEQDLQKYIEKRATRGSALPPPPPKPDSVEQPTLEPDLYVSKEEEKLSDPWVDEHTVVVLSTPEDELKEHMERIATEVSQKVAKPRRGRKPKPQ
jgi:hypothetical protein